MSFIEGLSSFLAGLFGALSLSILPTSSAVDVSNRVAMNSMHAIYKNSPRNLESCDFPDFMERLDLPAELAEVVIYRNDGTFEVLPV